jgi:hypothetical protein
MKVILFGGSGMVGQGVLRECLLDPDIEKVLSIGRSRINQVDPKIEEIVQRNLFDLSTIESRLSGYDGCIFTLGVSALRMSEADYAHLEDWPISGDLCWAGAAESLAQQVSWICYDDRETWARNARGRKEGISEKSARERGHQRGGYSGLTTSPAASAATAARRPASSTT